VFEININYPRSEVERGTLFQKVIHDKIDWKNINVSTPVLVLKLEHYSSLGIMRSLGRLGVPVYGVDKNKYNASASSKYCRKNYTLDIEYADEEGKVNFLINISKEINTKPVLITTSDETALFAARNNLVLKEHFIFPEVSFNLIKKLCSKKDMFNLARKYNLPVPKSYFPESLSQLKYISEIAAYPLMIKGIDGAKLEKNTGKKMMIVNNPIQLIKYYKQIEKENASNIMIQEYIPDTNDHMWIFNGYFDSDSDCLAAFTGRKLRQNPVYTGMTSLGICQWNEILIGISKYFLKSIGYKGAVDIDFVYDVRDGRYKILDVNPRIGASFRLFVGTNGLDTVRAQYLDLTGQPVLADKPENGRKWLVEDKDLLSSYYYIRDRAMRISDWIKSFNGVKEMGYFAKDDTIPSLYIGAFHIKKSFNKMINNIINNFSAPFNNSKEMKIKVNSFSMPDNIISEEFRQRKNVKDYYDQNKNWQGEIYKTSIDPHAAGVRRRKEYILQMIDKNFNFNNTCVRAIDIGCGPGAYMLELSLRGCSVFGIDLSTEMLRSCRKNLSKIKKNENLLCADAGYLPFNNKKFDIVICVGVLQYVISLEKAILELQRITNENGLVVVCIENMLSLSNIGYFILNKLKPNFKPKTGGLGNISSKTGIISRWFLNNVDVPHIYKLYKPAAIEKIMNEHGLNRISTITYGFPFKFLRRFKVIPEKFLFKLEEKLEFILTKNKIPVLSGMGEYYIGLFTKNEISMSQDIIYW